MPISTVTILDIQRMSSEDGPGLRTTVFFKGCPLACRWCHNPESIAFKGQILWHSSRCIGCASCVAACSLKGLQLGPEGVKISRDICKGCFFCSEACPAGALEAKGRPMQVQELCRELLKDRAYWGSEGGVTLSGGEALMQESAIDLLRLLREQGVPAALDTCGLLPEDRLRRALPYCNLVLYDVKIADSARHRQFTGADNETILHNLRVTADWARAGGRIWVRTPVIPGATDDTENIQNIGIFLAGLKDANGVSPVERWELCAFNNLCASKYASLDMPWEYEGVPLVQREKMTQLYDAARATNACKDTRWTGAVQD